MRLLSFDVQEPVTQARQIALGASIWDGPPGMVATIDLDDELSIGSEGIDNEGADDDLPAERDAELCTAKCLPEPSLGRGGGVTHDGGSGGDESGVMGRGCPSPDTFMGRNVAKSWVGTRPGTPDWR